ncbi:MAG: long-chain fatty acid--CoA ligase [Pseudomonadota bacterium]
MQHEPAAVSALMGLMMDRPLRIIDLLLYAAEAFPSSGVVSARPGGITARATYPKVAARVAQLAGALQRAGVEVGDRVATFAFNSARHLELYYAISGMGAVCHTINPRLSDDQLIFIINHAQDRMIFCDPELWPRINALLPHLNTRPQVVVMTDAAGMAPMAGEVLCYEDIIATEPQTIDWPTLPERTASGLCYTSGTTGAPKGALYTHRSTVLHALYLSSSLPDSLKERRRVLPAVPLFHVNAWGLPYTAPLTGASLVMPGSSLDGPSLFALMDQEEVTSAWGVPTVWMGLLDEIDRMGRLPKGFNDLVVGGSAAAPSMINRFEDMGVNVCHAWGMTEMSPIGSQGNLTAHYDHAPLSEQRAQKAKQGRRMFGVDFKIVSDEGVRLPHDGKAVGNLYVRGNSVISAYYNNAPATTDAIDAEGWFFTGDIAKVDPDGYLTLVDRAKDLIKSGGEWISSIDLENAALSHADVAQCAVIAVKDDKWGERPLLVVVPVGDAPDPAVLIEHLAGSFARWQLPDSVVFMERLPLTATGKISKLTLRAELDPAMKRAAR